MSQSFNPSHEDAMTVLALLATGEIPIPASPAIDASSQNEPSPVQYIASNSTNAPLAENLPQNRGPRRRHRATPRQLARLMEVYEGVTEFPDFEMRENLMHEIGMTNREIQVWFQNQRAKQRRIQLANQESQVGEKEEAASTVSDPSLGRKRSAESLDGSAMKRAHSESSLSVIIPTPSKSPSLSSGVAPLSAILADDEDY